MVQFFIVCPLVFLAGFADAVAGGGGLISLPAYLMAGLPVHTAIGTNKLSSAMGTAMAVGRFSRQGYIPWKGAALYVACALVGSAGGARLALLLDDEVFRTVMLVILPLTALYLLRSRRFGQAQAPYPPPKTLAIGVGIALGVGVYDGFYGPGTGTFLLLLLTAAAHMSLENANGIAKVINLTTNLTALVMFWVNGKVLLPLGLTAGVCSVAGNYLGTRFFDKGGAKAVKPVMLAVLAVFFIRVLTE
ncbi:MAG: TSUP family transporter [Evtepia sp.]|nr:TSUP family transporter [Evtepia sp.]